MKIDTDFITKQNKHPYDGMQKLVNDINPTFL
jgi:hypothetical protein